MNFNPQKDAVPLIDRWYTACFQDYNAEKNKEGGGQYVKTEERIKLYEDTKKLATFIKEGKHGNRLNQIKEICTNILNEVNTFTQEATDVLSKWIAQNTIQISEKNWDGAYPTIHYLIQAIIDLKNFSKENLYVEDLKKIDNTSIHHLNHKKIDSFKKLTKNPEEIINSYLDHESLISFSEVSKLHATRVADFIITNLKKGKTLESFLGREQYDTFINSKRFPNFAIKALNEGCNFKNLGSRANMILSMSKNCRKFLINLIDKNLKNGGKLMDFFYDPDQINIQKLSEKQIENLKTFHIDLTILLLNEGLSIKNVGFNSVRGVVYNMGKNACEKIFHLNLTGLDSESKDFENLKDFPNLKTLTLSENQKN